MEKPKNLTFIKNDDGHYREPSGCLTNFFGWWEGVGIDLSKTVFWDIVFCSSYCYLIWGGIPRSLPSQSNYDVFFYLTGGIYLCLYSIAVFFYFREIIRTFLRLIGWLLVLAVFSSGIALILLLTKNSF